MNLQYNIHNRRFCTTDNVLPIEDGWYIIIGVKTEQQGYKLAQVIYRLMDINLAKSVDITAMRTHCNNHINKIPE